MKKIAVWALLLGTTSAAHAQEPLSSGANTSTLGFDDFTAAGLAATPGRGQLDSDTFLILGASDDYDSGRAPQYGGTATGADYTRGESAGGVTPGGVYAFSATGSNGLGLQATSGDFSPGEVHVRYANADAAQHILNISIAYQFCVLNDQDRSSEHVLGYVESMGGVVETGNMQTTPAAATPRAVWSCSAESMRLDTNIAPGGTFAWVFLIRDAGGTGSRDEVAFDDITVTATFGTPTTATCGNGVLERGEGCDDGNMVDETECPYGEPTCTLCDSVCGMELSLTGRFCGDGTIDRMDGEACDDGNLVDDDRCTNMCQPPGSGGRDAGPPRPDGGVPPLDGGPSRDGGPTPPRDGGPMAMTDGGGAITDGGAMTDGGPVAITDGGPVADAGVTDDGGAAEEDAGSVALDASTPLDGGSATDAGSTSDGDDSGCAAGGSAPSSLWLGVLLLGLRRRRD